MKKIKILKQEIDNSSSALYLKSQQDARQDSYFTLYTKCKFQQNSLRRIQFMKDYIRNYQLIVKFLSFEKKPNIVLYNKIKKNSFIEMEKGLSFNHNWYGNVSKQSVSVEQKFRFIVDICKGLIDLSQLKLLHLDLNCRNIIKLGDTFKLIDFDRAFSVGVTDVKPGFRNYLRGSELQSIKRQLFQNTKQIISKQYQQYLTFDGKLEYFLLAVYEFYPLILDLLSEPQKDYRRKAQRILEKLQDRLEFIHFIQFAKLLEDIFNDEDIQQIDNYRISKVKPKENVNYKHLLQLISTVENCSNNNLIVFLNHLTYSIKDSASFIKSHPFLQKISRKNYSQLWKEIITKKDCELEQKITSFERFNYNQWSSSSFQGQIKLIIKKQISNHKIKQKYRQSHRQVNFELLSNGIPQGTYLLNRSGDENSVFGSQNLLSCEDNNKNNMVLQLKNKSQQNLEQNMKENYFVFKVLLFKYISTEIHSNYLYSPQDFCLNPSQTGLLLHFPSIQDQFQNIFDEQKIELIWSKSFSNIISFLKSVTKAILQLQRSGLFHPQLSLNNIVSISNKFTDKTSYKIKGLQACYFLSPHHMLQDQKEKLLNVNKMQLYYIINHQRQMQQFQHFSLNNLRQYLQQLQINLQKEQCMSSIQKTTLIFEYLRQSYHKIHSRKLGEILKNIFSYHRKNKKNKAFVPLYWQSKYEKLYKIAMELSNNNIRDRISVQTFKAQFNSLFPTCEGHDHQNEMIHFYTIQQQQKTFLCNRCIKYKPQKMQVYCIDHNKLIRYQQSNPKNLLNFGKYYYCEQCCEALPPNSSLTLIDSVDLNKCEYICMNLECKNHLISKQNREKCHSNHLTLTFEQFDNFYIGVNSQNSFQINQNCIQQTNACISQFMKITSSYINNTANLFREITQFKNINNCQCQMLQRIINPTRSQFKGYKKSLQEKNQTDFWRVLKIINFIYEKSKQEQYKMVTIEGFVQYCNFRFTELTNSANEQVKKILSKVVCQFQSDIFSTDIHQKILKFAQEKYGKVVNNQKKPEIRPVSFTLIPDKYNQIVKELSIQRNQMYLKDYFKQRNQQRISLQKLCSQRSQIYQNWINHIKGQNQNLNSKNNFGVKYANQDSLYETYAESLKKILEQEKTALKILQDKLSSFQRFNKQALLKRTEMLEYERQSIIQFKNELLSKVSLLNLQKINEQRSLIIKQLQYNKQIISVQLRSFHLQFVNYSRQITQIQLQKICKFANLECLQLTQQASSLFTVDFLDQILTNCKKLQAIHIKGGLIELIPCLDKLILYKVDRNFTFYSNTQGSINEKQKLIQLHRCIRHAEFNFPCVNLRLSKHLDAAGKDMILEILAKISELKLELCGPFNKNCNAFTVLEFIKKKRIKVTSLYLRKLKLSSFNILLAQIAKHGNIQFLTLINCLDYDEQFIKYCYKSLIKIRINGSLSVILKQQFIKQVLNCENLQEIHLSNTVFNVEDLSMYKLLNLKYLLLQYCPQITDSFLGSIPQKALKLIQCLVIKQCITVDGDFAKVLIKMSSLKTLNISTNRIPVQTLLELETSQLEVLHFRRATPINDYFLYKLGEKWPNLITLAIPQFSQISVYAIKKAFRNLSNLYIFLDQLTKEQKHELMMRKINIEEFN